MSAPAIYPGAKPPPLDRTQRAELRRELQRELARLLPGTRMLDAADFGVTLARELSPRPRSHALQLIDALRRLENGTYGLCAGCQGTISYERLSAIPETTVCAECSWNREATPSAGRRVAL